MLFGMKLKKVINLINSFKTALYKYCYLLIVAAWLFTISFLINNYFVYSASPKKIKQSLENKIATAENQFNAIIKDSNIIKLLIIDSVNQQKKDATDFKFGLFIYTLNDVGSPILTYWNNNKYSIDVKDIAQKDGYFFTTYPYGDIELIKQTTQINKQTIIAVAAVPVRWNYFIENKYLQKDFDGFYELDNQYQITNKVGDIPIINTQQKTIFTIKEKPYNVLIHYDTLTILLRLSSILLLLIFLHKTALLLVRKNGFYKGYLSLLFTVVLLRIVTYTISFPFNFSKLALFDPSIYASNFIHPSLGHLLVNNILLFWMVSFMKFNLSVHGSNRIYTKYTWFKYCNIILLFGAVYYFAHTINSLVQDSKISFDVTHFFSLNIYSVISFIVLTFITLTIFHSSHLLLKPLLESNTALLNQLIATTIIGLIYSSYKVLLGDSGIFSMQITLWCLLYITIINSRKKDIFLPVLQSTFFIFWIMFFAFSNALLISEQNKIISLAQQKKLIERLALDEDLNKENVLGIAISNVDTTQLENIFSRMQFEYANKYLKDSIISENFSGYLNKFEATIYTFNSTEKPLFNDDTAVSYRLLNNLVSTKSKATNIPDLYAYKAPNETINYIYKKQIGNKLNPLGYLFIQAKSNPYKSEGLYPVLFNQSQENTIDLNNNYPYAIYKNQKLLNKYGQYNFSLNLKHNSIIPFSYKQIISGNYNELWYNAGNDKTIIVVSNNSRLLELITLFAYLFFSIIIIVSIFHVATFLMKAKWQKPNKNGWFASSMRFQIHATIIFISVFSFVVIGTATITFFVNRFNTSNQERLSNTIEVIAAEINSKLKEVQTQLQFDDVLTINDVLYGSNFERKITAVSEVYSVDINFYSFSGTLIASTQPHIYSKQLLSNKINAKAFLQLKDQQLSKYIQTEQIGSLSYLSMYMPIVDENGIINAYLNIPYLNSQIELNQEISSFIATLINLNAFVFLIAGAIAFLLTERVVTSFSVIGEKMRNLNINQKNEPIVWEKNDEIGVLVKEYNKMTQQLDASIIALTKSEREGAWREMAQQVAHEIKNPLTPMKLSIQYLQNAIDNDAPSTKSLAQKVSTTLVEQIDQLANIANDFAQFANIGDASLEKIEIALVLESVINLFKPYQNLNIYYSKQTTEPVYILGNIIQLNRLFTNLIKNAIEAVKDNAFCTIDINQQIENDVVLISIQDNGSGISAEMKDKIFSPNFTTKTSGTGLGLAICKGIVEKLNGSLTFTTQKNKGTCFTIALPINKS